MTTLRSCFTGVAAKYLSAVDATPSTSNQHEINSNKFTAILGDPGTSKVIFEATFLYFNPDADEPEACEDRVTWYDTRVGQTHRSAEYRLYYRRNPVTELLREGDFCLIGMQTTGKLLIAIARPGSPEEYRLRHLFEMEQPVGRWLVDSSIKESRITLATRQILEAMGIEAAQSFALDLDQLLSRFNKTFPATKVFSQYARDTLPSPVSAIDDPDGALEAWMEHEEILFRALERSIVKERLISGFAEVEDFISFSLSVQNRRKSRVGHALENHLSAVFDANAVRYERGARTENNSRPDFLFPGAHEYHAVGVESPPLRMLGAKTTCKDRWRQVLTEAAKIPEKHLFTLETAISENQLREMQAASLTLVSTPTVLATYQAPTGMTMNLSEFVTVVK
ncbi:type II restriction endonuclease [Limnohabitans sp.]|uniref:type II restriction endonuclease n=1 Tax=Limnohabitans sp. TaxID=1907725 RepID=UPI0031203D35